MISLVNITKRKKKSLRTKMLNKEIRFRTDFERGYQLALFLAPLQQFIIELKTKRGSILMYSQQPL